MARSRLSAVLLTAGVLLVAGACVDLATTEPGEALFAQMNGTNMRPEPRNPMLGEETSFGIVGFQISGTRILYDVDFVEIDRITGATIHIGGPAVSAPPVATLFNLTQPETGSGRLIAGAVLPASALASGITLDSLIKAMRAGLAYVQAQTVPFPDGAMRAQTLPVLTAPPAERYTAGLSGANEAPPVNTPAMGEAHFAFRLGEVRYLLTATNIEGVTAAHIHTGAAGVVGPVVVTLFESPGTGPVNGQLATGVFSNTETDLSLDALLVMMRKGEAYVNVHTTAHPDGEIRGQILPVTFGAEIP